MLFSSIGKIRSGYGLAFLLLLVSYFLILHSTSQFRKETNRVTQSYVAINKLESLHTAIIQAETSVRGYVITKDSVFLNLYHVSIDKVQDIKEELEKLIVPDKEQRSRLDTLEHLVQERLSIFSSGIVLFRQADQTITKEMESRRERSLAVMDSIHLFIGKMTGAEEKMMKKRRSNLSGFFQGTQSLILISLIIGVIAILYSFIIYNRENRAKQLAADNANQYRNRLENNIRELKEINDELKELKSIEKFTSTGRISRTIAHELRNPLTNISLAAAQLQEEMSIHNNDASMLLDMISRNADRINLLASDLLNATRFIELTLQKTNINKLMDEALEMARDRIELNHIKVEKDYSPDAGDVMVDRDKIKLAFLNIIVNGIEAMENNKGILRLKTKKEGTKCIIEIRDNGKGMDEDTLQKIFEPYFTNKSKGNGLGLTNTQNIILNHKGSIKVNSHPHKGSVFIVSLDIA